jgi:hypothetical protein
VSILKNSADIFDLRLGATGASEAYLGDVLVWPIVGCGVTLRLPFGSAADPEALIDTSRPSKSIANSTGVVLSADANATDGICGDFTAGGNLLIRYPFVCDFLTRPFTVECRVKITSSNDVINLFERGTFSPGSGFSYYAIKLYSTYVSVYVSDGNTEQKCNVKLFFPAAHATLVPGNWYRIVVQRDEASRFTVYVNNVPGLRYRPIFGHPFVDSFHDSLEYIIGQYFNPNSFVGVGDLTFRQVRGINNNVNHVDNRLLIGGAGYIDDYKVTVCTPPVASIARIPAPGPDPHYGNVALLLHFNEIEEQEFVDSGPYGFEPEKVGSPVIVQATASGRTNNLTGIGPFVGQVGAGNAAFITPKYLVFSGGASTSNFTDVFDLGADDQDFTIEFWAKGGAGGAVMGYYVTYPTNGGYPRSHYGWQVNVNSYSCSQGCTGAAFSFTAEGLNPDLRSRGGSGSKHFYGGTGTAADICEDGVGNCVNRGLNIAANGYQGVYANYQVFADEWHHYAVARSGNTIRLFLDGRLVAYGPVPFNFSTAPARAEYVGNADVSPRTDLIPPVLVLGGWMKDFSAGAAVLVDEVRITRGVARYTADFELQSRAFPDTSPTPTPPAAPTILSIDWI